MKTIAVGYFVRFDYFVAFGWRNREFELQRDHRRAAQQYRSLFQLCRAGLARCYDQREVDMGFQRAHQTSESYSAFQQSPVLC